MAAALLSATFSAIVSIPSRTKSAATAAAARVNIPDTRSAFLLRKDRRERLRHMIFSACIR
jgi:hypothetical protein